MSNPTSTKTNRDKNGFVIQVFTPNKGTTLELATPLNPTEDMVVKIATDVTISVGGTAVPYLAGDILGMSKGVVYSFSADTLAHVM